MMLTEEALLLPLVLGKLAFLKGKQEQRGEARKI